MTAGGRNKSQTHNRLWLARKRRGLGQKQVAYLLNHSTNDQVSRFEKGLRLPTLETALMLEIVYGTPLRILFKELYEQVQEEIRGRIKNNPQLERTYGIFAGEEESARDFCASAEILNIPNVSPAELVQVRNHITYLAKKYARLI